MRIKLYLLCAAMLICGSIVAQEHYYQPASGFENNMTFRARVCIDGEEQQSVNVIEIGAFDGDVCTDSKFVKNFGSNNYYRVNMTIGGASTNYPLTFKLYNHTEGMEEEMLNYILTDPDGNVCESLMWSIDANYGSYKSPYTLNFIHSSTHTLDITGYGEGEGGYYLIASPVTEEITPTAENGFLTNAYDLYYFDQAATDGLEWINYKNEAFNLESGKGYLYANSADVTLTFTGAPYSGTGVVTLTKDDAASFAGWNLVGNPFAETAYITKPFYVMNEDGTEIVSADGNSVEAMEGIFVIADNDGEEMTFSTTEPSKGNQQLVVNVMRNNRGAAIDRAIVRFNEEKGLPKFQLNPNSTKVYIPQSDKDYAVVQSELQGEVPVNFKASKNGTYTFSVTANEVDVNYLHLIDNLTGDDVDLLQTSSYSFEAKTTDYATRFRLVFDASATGLEESFAFYNGSNWVIENDGKAVLQVVDVTGRILSSKQINGSAEVNIGEVAGVYMLRLVNGNDVKVQKVVVR